MNCIYVKARAKINLALDVLGKRPDGYHNLQMIMQSLSLCDDIFIKKTKAPGVKLVSNNPLLPVNQENLAYQAAARLIEEFNIQHGIYIYLNKVIPVGAGLAGGSTNCAATLVALRKLLRLPITDTTLLEMGREFGADVPYCLMRGTAFAEGTGERLTRLQKHPDVTVLLAKPGVNISTKQVFSQYNPNNVTKRPNIPAMLKCIKNSDLKGIAKGFCNVLESVTISNYPEVSKIKEIMLELNALGAVMSGSGPTVFGYFDSKESARLALCCLTKEMPNLKEVFLTTVFNPNIREER